MITPLVGAAALGTGKAVGYSAALALATGAVYVALGLLRMGWVSTFLSKAVMAGFVLGFSIGIIIDQSHKLLGVPAVDGSYVAGALGDAQGDPRHQPDHARGRRRLAGSAAAHAPLPATLAAHADRGGAGHHRVERARPGRSRRRRDRRRANRAVLGRLPASGGARPARCSLGALSIVFVGYSESLAAGRAMARKHGYEIDPNQELIAQGMACGAAGFVGGFATDGSLSKTSVADAAGQRTQMASLINAGFVLLTMLFLASLFENLPSATLGAVVIDAMLGLITFAELKRYYRVNRADWVFFMGAGLGILCFGIIQGIVIGVVLSLLLLIARSSRTSVRELGTSPTTGTYHEAQRHEGLEAIPGVLIARVDGPLFFADADRFRTTPREPGAARRRRRRRS